MRALLLTALIFSLPSAWASFKGQLQSSTDYYLDPIDDRIDRLIPYLQFQLENRAKLGAGIRSQFKFMGFSNLEAEGAPEQAFFDLSEAYLGRRKGLYDIEIGFNTLNWGVVDLASPSDVVNTTSLFHPVRPLKRGAPMVRLEVGPESQRLEAVYIPWQMRPQIPSPDSRWLPREYLKNVNVGTERIAIPDFIEYSVLENETLDRALQNNAGVRLRSHWGDLDTQIFHFDGAAPQPKVRPTITLDATTSEIKAVSPVGLTPVTYRVRTSGIGAVWARESFITRFESVYQHTVSNDPLLQPWSWTNVIGVETAVDVGTTSLTLLAQYYSSENPQSPDNLITSNYRLFDRTGVLGLRWPYSDGMIWTGSVLYETESQGVFATIGFDRRYTDTMRWGLSYKDFSAQEEGLLKTYDRNDHGTFDLTYYF